jgi:hypothetical protein
MIAEKLKSDKEFIDKADAWMSNNEGHPQYSEIKQKRDTVASTYKSYAAQLSLETQHYKKRGMASVGLGSRRRGGARDKIRQEYISDISDFTGIPKEEIDIYSGAEMGDRFKVGLKKDPVDKFNYYIEQYGQDNVLIVPDGPAFKTMIRDGDKFKLVDEVGFTLKDIADISRSSIQTTAEVGSAVLATYATGGQSLLLPALAAGFGSGVSSLGIDSYNELSGDSGEGKYKDALTSGLVSFSLDYGLSKGFSFIAPAFVKGGRKIPEANADAIAESLEYIANKTGKDMPITPAQQRTTRDLVREATLASNYPKSGIAKKRAEGRDIVAEFQKTFNTGDLDDFDTFYKNIAIRYAEDLNDAIADIAKTDRSLAKAIHESAERTIDNFGKPTQGAVYAGQEFRENVLYSAFDDAVKASKRNYRAAFTPETENAIDALPIARRIQNTISGLNIPKNEADEVLKSFLPSSVAKEGQKAAEIGRVNLISLEQLDTWKSDVGRMLQSAKGKDKAALGKLYDDLSTLAQKNADNLGVGQQYKAATEFYRDNIIPMKEGSFGRLIKMGKNNEPAIQGDRVLFELFDGSKRIDNLQLYKKLVKTPESRTALRNAYASYLDSIARGRTGGELNFRKLVNGLREDVVREVYGDLAVRNVRALKKVAGTEKSIDINMPDEIIQMALNDISEAGGENVAKAFQHSIRAQRRKLRLVDQEIKKSLSKQGSAIINNVAEAAPEATIASLRNLNATEVGKFLSYFPKAEQEVWKRKLVSDLYDMASTGMGKVQHMSRAKGQSAPMWDVDKMESLLSNKSYMEMMNAVVGRDTMESVAHSNNALKAYAVSWLGKHSDGVTVRGVGSMRGIRPYLSLGHLADVSYNMMSIIHSVPLLRNAALRTEMSQDFTAKMMPLIIGSREGLELLMQDSSNNPDLRRAVNEYIAYSRLAEQKD